ncbi:hypothetical protein [Novipirellula rosea]|uniref:hypothetical protein n=1 Tax=Novipirellula rosea TaxID=1031540 RepID=UPI0031EB674A
MNDAESTTQSKFLPFWATAQYGGGVMQGMGVACASLFLINSISSDYLERYGSGIGIMGFVLIVVGGLRARKTAS